MHANLIFLSIIKGLSVNAFGLLLMLSYCFLDLNLALMMDSLIRFDAINYVYSQAWVRHALRSSQKCNFIDLLIWFTIVYLEVVGYI